jgi:hypothetical protein
MVSVRRELRPTLPAALHARLGVAPLVTIVAIAVLAGLGVAAATYQLTRPPGSGEQVVHRGKPTFNLLAELMHPVPPRSGELLRVEGRRGQLTASVFVRPLRLPPYHGDVPHGFLPLFADGFLAAERAQLPGFVLRQEGRARINNAIGYELIFQSLRPGSRTFGRDVLLSSDDPDLSGTVLLSMRQVNRGGTLDAHERELADAARRTYKSFTFGTGRS